jgi:cell division protein FtsW
MLLVAGLPLSPARIGLFAGLGAGVVALAYMFYPNARTASMTFC